MGLTTVAVLLLCVALYPAATALRSSSDRVDVLPGYGPPKTRHFAGLLNATAAGHNRLFYYFVEADIGSGATDTPLLIWLNGGPGASSMMGLMVENLGPQKITVNSTLVDNSARITKKYHLLVIDNPVGAGYSYTTTGAYVTSEEEMRTQFVYALRGFYDLHREYRRNPLWVCGESYAGKYIPHIAYELTVNATDIPLQGIVVGNGMYDEPTQYQSIGEMAFGVIDEHLLAEVMNRQRQCVAAIYRQQPEAGDFCENITVRWLYTGSAAAAGEYFYYDFGIADANELDRITASLGGYLNRPDVRAALHVGDAEWRNADETGPVARALAVDFTRPSAPVVAELLGRGKAVTMYNGVRDGSVCNHIGNLRALLRLRWPGAEEFAEAASAPWPSRGRVMGHVRRARHLTYATVMRTGHLVPTVVPEAYAVLLDMVLRREGGDAAVDGVEQ